MSKKNKKPKVPATPTTAAQQLDTVAAVVRTGLDRVIQLRANANTLDMQLSQLMVSVLGLKNFPPGGEEAAVKASTVALDQFKAATKEL